MSLLLPAHVNCCLFASGILEIFEICDICGYKDRARERDFLCVHILELFVGAAVTIDHSSSSSIFSSGNIFLPPNDATGALSIVWCNEFSANTTFANRSPVLSIEFCCCINVFSLSMRIKFDSECLLCICNDFKSNTSSVSLVKKTSERARFRRAIGDLKLNNVSSGHDCERVMRLPRCTSVGSINTG